VNFPDVEIALRAYYISELGLHKDSSRVTAWKGE